MRRGSRQLKSILNYIDGQFLSGKRDFPDVNPADGTVIAQVRAELLKVRSTRTTLGLVGGMMGSPC